MTISIEDLGDRRRLTVTGTQWDGTAHRETELSLETVLSVQTLEELARLNSEEWVINDVRRTELPEYIERPLRAVVEKFRPAGESPVILDFGCGTGQSTVAIARAGFKVIGVDRNTLQLNAARMRVRDYGLDQLASFVDTSETAELPFEPGSFDAVIASGVFEHIRPGERRQFALECWRMLKPGGVFYVVGSPNRLWPIEGHTTNLPLVHWLPLSMSMPLIHRWSKSAARGWARDEIIDGGIYGVNLFGLMRSLPGSKLMVAEEGNAKFCFSNIWNAGKGRRIRRIAFGIISGCYRALERPLRWIRVPIEAFFPYTYVAIRKDAGA